ncbi:hypothetical protein glysoja_044435, partial [Glycine soja]
YYSMYGHVEKLAEEIKKGAASVEGVEAKLWLTSITQLVHHGMIFVPIGYSG